MSSAAAEPREDTPLLRDDASPTTATAPRNDGGVPNDDEESQRLIDDARREAAVARVTKALKILFSLTIGTGTVALAFNIASMIMLKYGGEMFGYWNWSFESDQWSLFGLVIVGVVFSIFNLYHLSQRPHPFSAFLNILVFLIDGFYTFVISVRTLSESDILIGTDCDPSLDDDEPPNWGRSYPGSYKQCLDWEPSFQIVSWLWLCFAVVAGLAMLALGIASLVRVYKLRSRRVDASNGERDGSRWTIPAGQVTFQFSLFWGAPAPEGEGRPRRGESEFARTGQERQAA